jgi:glutamate-1-semialdehyde 2,1-aminomutase
VHLAVNVKLWNASPLGGVYQAGTLSGNPLAMRAGIEMFKHLRQPDFYTNLNAKLEKLLAGLQAAADEAGIPFKTQQAGRCLVCTLPIKTTLPVSILCLRVMLKLSKSFHGMLDRGKFCTFSI